MNRHMARMLERHPDLKACTADVERAFETLRDAFRAGGKVLLCGNGGSAADAEHIAGELMKGFEKRRPLEADARASLPADLAESLHGALPAVPLTGFPALSTAFANDARPEFVFAQAAWGLARPGDVLVALTTSGNSANVIHACHAARARGARTIALTGQSGGRIASVADVTIRVPGTRTCEVQEYHLPVYHCLCLMLEDEFFGG